MKKYIKTLLILLACPLLSYSQGEPPAPESFGSRVFTGGTVGLQFGDYTFIQIAPIVGYRVTEKFTPGISATYIYSKFKDPYGPYTYSSSIYGGSVFARYYFLENIFGHVELEILNLDVPNTTSYYNNFTGYHRQNIAGIFVGGGYRERLGARSSMNILLLYDINQDPFSPYENPIIKIGFGIGI